MTEATLGSGFINYLTQRSYPQFRNELAQHWLHLQTERAQSIHEVQQMIEVMNPTPPYYYCNIAYMQSRVDFDFGGKKPIGLVSALYYAVAEDRIIYSADGQLIAARPGKGIISPPFVWEGRGHYIVDPDQVVKLDPEHPAAKVFQHTKIVLKPDGLIWGEDNAFLLSLITGEPTPNRQLLESFGLLAA